ncbi:hypothetical protein AAHB66_12145 [Leclercia sp. S52]|uniref:hypothetical protein n=1 Tax=Leclercia sp. S52 TaxID=3138178 RepID=UPI00321A5C60
MKQLVAFSFGLLFAAPALAIDMPPPAPVKSIEWLPASTVRIGQGINAAYRVTTMTGQSSEIWIHTDCQTQDKTLLFINTLPGKGLRVYSTDSIDRFTPGTPFEPEADSPFMTTPGLDLCKQNIPAPKWAGLSSPEKQGDKQFIDLNSSLREGTMLKARLATDFDKVHHDEKYGAPYSIKIQDVELNCETAQGRVLNTFSLDTQGRVTDTGAATGLSPEMTRATKTLCASPDLAHFKGTGTLTLRNKDLADTAPVQPDLEHNTPAALQRFALPTEVTAVINKTFSDPQYQPAFRSLSYTQSGPETEGPGLTARVDAQPDGTTLTIVRMAIGNAVFYSQYQRLFNIVDVKKWETMSEAPWVSTRLDNWITLPLQPGKAFSWFNQLANRDKPQQDKTLSQTCVAGKAWHNAADIHPNLPGRYLEYICKEDRGDGKEASSDYAWFEALRVFIRIGYQDNFQPKRFTFSDVVVTR